MKIIFLLFTTLLFFTSSAQQQLWLTDPSQYGKPLESSTGVQISGDPYLFENWKPGLATMLNNERFKIPKIRYNVLKEQVEYDKNGRIFSLPSDMFSSFVLIDGRDSIIFKNGLIGVKDINVRAYAQVVYEKKNKWLCKHYANLVDDPESTYGSEKKKIIQKDKSYFFLKPNEESIRLKLSRKFFLKTFETLDAPEFDKFLHQSGLKFEEEKDLQAIFKWVDERTQ